MERQLLCAKLSRLARCLDPGLTSLNWNSLAIPDFVSVCSRAVKEFQGVVSQVQKNSVLIEKAIAGIAYAQLVADPAEGEALLADHLWSLAAACGLPPFLLLTRQAGNLPPFLVACHAAGLSAGMPHSGKRLPL